jgi:hypothetical protein
MNMNNQVMSKLIICLALPVLSFGQQTWKDTSKISIPELKHNLNKSGSHFLKATVVGQMWVRNSDMNPGSMIYTTPVSNYTDFGIRRLRFSAFGQLTDRLYFYTQFGQNNFNFLSKRYTGAFVHDAITEYKVMPQLQIGAGLTGWSGLSRYASPAVGSLLSFDAPLYQQVTNGINDQFLRKLSVYAKGQIGKLDYRFALTSPMAIQNSAVTIPAISSTSNFALDAPKLQTQGYVYWQFFDKENNSNPYTTGTYLGKKKILNLGAGWIHQKNAMWYTNTANDTIRKDMLLLGVDAFLDMPIAKKGAAITAYVAYNNYQMGHNYLRNVGVMNPATDVNASGTLNGTGVGVPMIGTGNTIYGQFGYKFKNNLLPENGTLQPYFTIQYSQFEKLKDPMILMDGGVNWLIHGTHAGKITLGYQSRPVFEKNTANEYVQTGRKGMAVLQYQISL